MDTADPVPDKSGRAPTHHAPAPNRNTPRETERSSSPDRLPPSAPPDRYTAPRNSLHTAPKDLPLACGPPPRPLPRPILRPTLHWATDRIPPLLRPSSPPPRVPPRSPHTSPRPLQNP